jgi:hypothetical protein
MVHEDTDLCDLNQVIWIEETRTTWSVQSKLLNVAIQVRALMVSMEGKGSTKYHGSSKTIFVSNGFIDAC